MTDFHKALYDFWSQFSSNGTPVNAYISGRVPDEAEFPYITFNVVEGSFGGNITTSANCWFLGDNGNVMIDRAALLDQIADAIPPAGTVISWSGGGAVLRRNDSGFLSYYDVEPEEPNGYPVLGGRIGYHINFFNV